MKYRWDSNGSLKGCSAVDLGFGGEESAGASFLQRDGTTWSTDKDGILLGLLSAEMMAKEGRDPGESYRTLTEQFGDPAYERVDAPANPDQKAVLAKLSAKQVEASELAGEKIVQVLTEAPGNGAPIGGLKVVTAERLVRGAALGDGRRLQNLRRELSRPRALDAHSAGSKGIGRADVRRARLLTAVAACRYFFRRLRRPRRVIPISPSPSRPIVAGSGAPVGAENAPFVP